MGSDWLDTALRLLAATAAGMALGLDRDIAGKPLGTRTLGLVGLSASLVALSVTDIPAIAEMPDALARVIQGLLVGVLTGIGFLGSGVIVRRPDENRVENLTTAATIWATAALGIVAALASWSLFAVGVGLTIALLVIEKPLERLVDKRHGRD
jgi:putative Mg2+ transporter-C (MgtC) family protein